MADSGKGFNMSTPPRGVTNPLDPEGTTVGAPYPKHLHRHVVPSKDEEGVLVVPEGALVVAWAGKAPIYNEFIEVGDAKAEADAIEKGYSDKPVLKVGKK